MQICGFIRRAKHLAFGPVSSALEHGLLSSPFSPIVCWHGLEHAHGAAAILDRLYGPQSIESNRTMPDISEATILPMHSTAKYSPD